MSCHLFLISSASVRSLPFLSFIMPISAWNVPLILPIFLEISSLSHSIVFLYFFALFTEGGVPISPCYASELCIVRVSFPFLLLLVFFSQLFVRPPQAAILPPCISFSLGWFWSVPHAQCYEFLSIVLQALCLSDLIPWIYLSPPLYNHKGFDLGQTWMA